MNTRVKVSRSEPLQKKLSRSAVTSERTRQSTQGLGHLHAAQAAQQEMSTQDKRADGVVSLPAPDTKMTYEETSRGATLVISISGDTPAVRKLAENLSGILFRPAVHMASTGGPPFGFDDGGGDGAPCTEDPDEDSGERE